LPPPGGGPGGEDAESANDDGLALDAPTVAIDVLTRQRKSAGEGG
jgi:hypothetical protein